MICKRCESSELSRAGFVTGEQRYKCKRCNYQFVPTRNRNRSTREKETALTLYLKGQSMNSIAKLIGVSPNTIMLWVREYGKRELEDKPPPSHSRVEIEVDEMWHFLQSKANKLWIWKAYCRTSNRLIDWVCGKRDKATFMQLYERLKEWRVDLIFADHWEVYKQCIPEEILVQSKTQTVAIERNNFRQRHWLARFKRKTCVVSKSLEMVNFSIALFASYHINRTLSLKTLF